MSVLKIKNTNNEWESVPVINGENGVSPTITTSKVGKETTLTITDVNGTHTATILDGVDGTGSGDMTKSVYDTNDNGIVDNAEKVNNHTVQSDVPANAVFTDTTYTAGTGIAINNGVISNTQTSAAWGNITGTLSDQTDLQTELSNKASKSYYSDTTINVGRKSNTTVGSHSTAEGIDTTASGATSHAEGGATTASGATSHAEGGATTASGVSSHAEGIGTTASYFASHAEGGATTASGRNSHAEGWAATASGVNAHAEGENTVANSKAQHVFGRYNISDTNDDTTKYGSYVEIVGNGIFIARSNARTLDWSGNETLAGGLTAGGTVVAGSIRTKNMFDGNSLVLGSIAGTQFDKRISSRQTLYLEPGTYTFSCNIASTYRFGLLIRPVPPPNNEDASFDSGWITDTSTYTFTIVTGGYFGVNLSRTDNEVFTTTDINNLLGYNYQLEVGDTVTEYSPHQNLKPSAEDMNRYSTGEIKIGTWIDRKPIYRKVVVLTSFTAGETVINHNISNIDKVINVSGFGLRRSGECEILPTIVPPNIQSDFQASIYDINDTRFIMYLGRYTVGTGDKAFTNMYIIFEYTKTTD